MMTILKRTLASLCALAALSAGTAAAQAAPPAPATLTVYAAGTLAVPFRKIDEIFARQHPEVTVRPQFAGSVKLARQLADLHEVADVYAAADYGVFPKYLMAKDGKPGLADWYIGFVRNAITFVYTDQSKGAKDITPQNWYKILARPGVQIGRSNPDTDPSGYQTLLLLDLAGKYYHDPKLKDAILANAPKRNMRDTETALLSVLQAGEIDYLGIYRSDALQHHLKFIDLPDAINLSSPKFAGAYAAAVAHTHNGDIHGKPIVYAITIPTNAAHKALAEKYIETVLSPEGQKVLAEAGFQPVQTGYAVGREHMPAALQSLTTPWPAD